MKKNRTISKEEVKKIAGLAKLSINEDEIELYTDQMNQILDYVSQLYEVDTDNVEPLSHVLDVVNKTRTDTVKPSVPRDTVLKNAAQTDDEFILVPEIIRAK